MRFDIISPATGETVNSYPEMPPEEVNEALERCHAAQREWRQMSHAERARRMLSAREILLANKEEYARLMALEMGKIYPQGIAEIEKCAWGCQYYAETAAGFLRPERIETEACKSFVTFNPLGIVLAIMPWNFPFWQVFRCAVPALLAGNGVVLKHAPSVVGCALKIEDIFRDAGFPEHLFRTLVIGVPQTTQLIHHRLVAAVSITASVRAGRAVASEAGQALKKCVLELGGSDPFVVLEDADVEKAVEVGIVSRFQNSGQSCIAAKRFIVVKAVRAEFETRFVEVARKLKMGDPMEEGVYVGPQARLDLRDALHEQVMRSVAAGARLLLGGDIPDRPGAFYPATVITDVQQGMAAWSEELFGPVASIIPVADEAEAIAVANCTEFGLGGAVWTQDLARGERIAAEMLESGAGFVNDMSKSDPRMPFGGIRNSGYGRELSHFGLREFVNVHSVWVNRVE